MTSPSSAVLLKVPNYYLAVVLWLGEGHYNFLICGCIVYFRYSQDWDKCTRYVLFDKKLKIKTYDKSGEARRYVFLHAYVFLCARVGFACVCVVAGACVFSARVCVCDSRGVVGHRIADVKLGAGDLQRYDSYLKSQSCR